MPGEVDRMDGNERFRQLVSSENSKLLATLLSELGAAEAKKLIAECYSDQPVPALVQCIKKAGDGSDGKHEEILDCCRLLIKYGCDVNAKDPTSRTPLHWACAFGNGKLASLLLDHGADPSIADASGFNSLHLAVNIGAIECVRLIVGHNKELTNRHDDNGATPILTAVEKGDADLLDLLVTSGGDVNAQERSSKRTPLHYSLYLKTKDTFEYLLDNGADLTKTDHRETNIVHRCCAVSDPWFLEQILRRDSADTTRALRMEDSEGATPVIVACQNGNIDQLRMLVEAGAPVANKDKHRRCALHHCAENTDTRCAEYILRSIPSLMTSADEEGLAPLHMAVIAGNIPLIKLLLKRGANFKAVDNEKHTVAHWATVCGHSDVLDVLLESGAELSTPDKHQAYPIHYAAQMNSKVGIEDSSKIDGDQLILKTLLKNKVSPESEDKDKRTPIIWAASAGNDEACRILVEFGADVNRADKDDLTALHCAASRGHASCVTTLIQHCQAEVDPVDKNQCTPLFYATTLGHIECMRVLLDLGADSKHTDTRGRTLGHCATVSGSTEALQVLKEYKVDLWARNLKGDQPIHEASQSGHIEVVRYLLDHSYGGQSNVIDSGNNDGRTCLHIAALTNNVWLCKFLLERDAHVNAVMMNKDKYYTPYDAALIKGHKEAKDLLFAHSGRPASAVTDHAAGTIQVKYRYHVKHKAPSAEPVGTPAAEAAALGQHAERTSGVDPTPATESTHRSAAKDILGRERGTAVDSGEPDAPKYVDKATQITTARAPKLTSTEISADTDRKVVNPPASSALNDDRINGQLHGDHAQKHGELKSKELDRVSGRSPGPSSKRNSSYSTTRDKRKLIRKGKSSHENTSYSEEGETHSERSTSHGNTSDIESCSSDPILRNKVRKAHKVRGGRSVAKTASQTPKYEHAAQPTGKSTRKHPNLKSSSEESSWRYNNATFESEEHDANQQHVLHELSQEDETNKSLEHTTSFSSDDDRVTAQDSSPSSRGTLSSRRKSDSLSHSEMGAACGAMTDPNAVQNHRHEQTPLSTAAPEEPVPLKKKQTANGRRRQNPVRTKTKNNQQENGRRDAPTTPKSVRKTGVKSEPSPRKLKPIERTDSGREENKKSSAPALSDHDDLKSVRKNKLTPIEKNGDSKRTDPKSETHQAESRKSSPRKPPKANGSFDDLHSDSDGSHGNDTHVDSAGGNKEDQRQKKRHDEQDYTDVERTDSGQLNSQRKKKTRPTMLIQTIQASVKRYEDERESIRQLHQIKRALIYAGPANDKTVFRKVLTQHQQGQHKQTSGTDSWEIYLKAQVKLLQERRKQYGPTSASRGGSKSAGGHGAPKAGYHYSYKRTMSLEKQTSTGSRTETVGQQRHHNHISLDETRRDPHDVASNNGSAKRQHYTSQFVDHYGYYDDPRRSNSLKAIKKRQEFAQLQLIKAYRPFAGAEIFAAISPRPTTAGGRPTSTMSVGTNSSLGSKTNGRKTQPSTTVMTLYGSRKIRQGNYSDNQSNTDKEKSHNRKKSTHEITAEQGIDTDKENKQEKSEHGAPPQSDGTQQSSTAVDGNVTQESFKQRENTCDVNDTR